MFLRQSTTTLQDALRNTMKTYVEEKTMLRTQLANLRLDLQDLHHDNRTVTTDDMSSHFSLFNGSEAELKRLEEVHGDPAKSLQLPAIKNLHLTPGRKGGVGGDAHRSKNLRFNTRHNTMNEDAAQVGKGKSFLNDPSWDTEKKEHQKFQELQKNQEFLRSIGRANLREKRQSLIRLHTINSATKRTALWDSGKNVSRPKGKSTAFETFPYVEASIAMSKRHFKIPQNKDPHRSEIQLGQIKKPEMNKRKVHFTRPKMDSTSNASAGPDASHNVSVMGGESLNTTLADTTMGDITLGNISFDEEQLKALTQRSQGGQTTANTSLTANPDSSKDSSFTNKQPKGAGVSGDETDASFAAKSNANPKDSGKLEVPSVPPLKLKPLLHDLTNMRTSPGGQLLTPRGKRMSDKHSNKSMGTKVSRLSQETEEWKSLYLNIPDPDLRKRTLSDIMFAVRARMRENEETLRFGETPRPSDNTYCDYLLTKHTPRLNGASPRKLKPVTKRGGRRGQATHTAMRADKRKDSTTQIQGYLRKMHRQRRTIDRTAGEDYRLAHFAGHKELQMVAQEA